MAPLLKEILIRSLLAVIAYRLVRVAIALLLAPPGDILDAASERLRIIPMTGQQAAFWARHISVAAGWFAFGWITVLAALEFSRPSQQLVVYLLSVVLVAIGLEAVWRRPRAAETVAGARSPWLGRRAQTFLWSLYFLVLWLLWVASAMRLFWLVVVAVALPGAAILARRAVNNLLGPAGADPGDQSAPSVTAAVIERGVRAGLILGAIFFLASAWGLDVTEVASHDTFAVRAIRGLFSAVVILLLADLAWQAIRTLIDQKLVAAQAAAAPGSKQARRSARLQTLLPILRNTIMVVPVIVAVLMMLSSIGVEVGPLIAGAGVLGVAIGFGAQTGRQGRHQRHVLPAR